MNEFKASDKAFIIPNEAWYSETVEPVSKQSLFVGFYTDDEEPKELGLVWRDTGIQLQVCDNAWEALSHMPELIQLLAQISHEKKNLSIKEFAEMLKSLGYKDITERVPGKGW